MRAIILLGGPLDGQVKEIDGNHKKIVTMTPNYQTGGLLYPDGKFINNIAPYTRLEYEEREKDIFYFVET